MTEFRFRAGAALELRARQEDAAARAVAQAEGRLREAQAGRASVDAQRQAAQVALSLDQQRGIEIAALLWHRNWISRLAETAARLGQDVERRRLEARAAEAAWHEARRKRLALERLRQRAWRTFQQARTRDELKTIDELARLRFVARDGDRNGEHSDG